ncbi:hypothetical protein PGT21_017806 [Puccinia graminis f. sp. tritici]|uniref:Secreted protein n=1 Tax=Puccinia graminis f. sp. tritici TaxID=56615 RepID=A0A5B0LTV8_PUCGR|nr:hypothetical protein PGT21_017806 [Puccinia graminis f. sp. tritici]KAA1093437.1 hypothetical protein PGTUg99_015125 [Puccinia graminis f. sp. tritici]
MKLITTLEVSIVLMTLNQVSGQISPQRLVDSFDCSSFPQNGPFCVKPTPNSPGSFLVGKARLTEGNAAAGPKPFCNDLTQDPKTKVNGTGTCCDKRLQVPTTLNQVQLGQKCGTNGGAPAQTNKKPSQKTRSTNQ